MSLILFNKPYGVMSQFSAHETRKTLASYIDLPNVYPAGRLDADSEGLMLLTDNGQLQQEISHPDYGKEKPIWSKSRARRLKAAFKPLGSLLI